MIGKLMDLLCGGSVKRIWDVVYYDRTWDGIHCSRAACPICESNKFHIWFSGGLFSLGCVECGWYSGINNTGNKMNMKMSLQSDGTVKDERMIPNGQH